LVADAEFRSPLGTKTVALSVRRSIVTGSDKKAKLGEKQTPDPKYHLEMRHKVNNPIDDLQ
jgi:hypothetical protein